MRFVAFRRNGLPALGLKRHDDVFDLAGLGCGFPSDLVALLRAGESALERVRKFQPSGADVVPQEGIEYLPPIFNPAKIICVGLNYADHVSEAHFDKPEFPVLFSRFASTLVGHGQPLIRPRVSEQLDYEGELVAVIGKPGRHIERANALAHVAGYSIFNESSIRDYQFKSHHWMIGKNFDGTGGFGPEFVTADELPSGAAGLRLQTRLNGRTMQDANTRDMIFDVAELIAIASEVFRFDSGDIIVTGTPAGVGFTRKPPVFMKQGDVCEVEIEGIGLLRNPIEDEASA